MSLPKAVAKATVVAVFFLTLIGVAAAAPGALAAGPVWHVATASLPSYLAPGESGQYQLYVTNVSATPSSGVVTVTDTLPPGVVATEAGDVFSALFPTFLVSTYWHCSGTTVVTCTSDPVKLPSITQGDARGVFADSLLEGGETSFVIGNAPVIGINVTAQPGAAEGQQSSAIQVAGGGAVGTTTVNAPMVVSGAPVPPGLQHFELNVLNRDGTADTQAGSHPYEMTTSFAINTRFPAVEENPVGDAKDVEVDLPVGLVGNIQGVRQCPRTDFDGGVRGAALAPECPADTQIGVEAFSFGRANNTLRMPVYNLTHPNNVPAEFGFGAAGHAGIIDAGLRTGDGYGLKVTLGNIEKVGFMSSTLTIWGEPADPNHNPDRCNNGNVRECGISASLAPVPLLTLPTSCGLPLSMTLRVDFWQEPGTFQMYNTAATDNHGNALSLTGCERLQFNPSLTLQPGVQKANSPTGLNVDLHMPQNQTAGGLAESNLDNATVAFPAGLTVNPSAADGLQGCSPQQIGLEDASVPSCPDASKIGIATIETPLLAYPLKGSVFLAEQTNNPFGSLIAVYLVAEAEGGIVVKVPGHITLNAASGQLTATFKENPPLPFSDLRLELFGGPRAPLVTPSACGTYTTSTQFLGYDGALASFNDPFTITSGCSGAFNPTFAAGMTGTAQAGAFAPFTLRITRSDEDQLFGGIQIHTPPGLLGALAGVPLCEEPQASQGTCSPQSVIGHTTVAVGAGEEPFYIHAGQIFLTGPYKGAPFGLSIAVPAVAGPFNLGTVVVRAAISIDPHTAQLTVTTDPLPQIVQGIPILLRSVEATIDRPGFTFNPTSCDPTAITASLTGSHGATASISSRYQAANCAGLAFRPAFHVASSAHTSKANGASLDVKLTFPKAPFGSDANVSRVKVELPKLLPSRLTTLQKACLDATFDQNPALCPPGSIVGSARANTPTLPVPLSGPAYFVSHGGAKFPELIIVLEGDGVRVDLAGETFISKAGVTSSTFNTVPDVPVSSFELYLPEGPHSALTANGSLCKAPLLMPTFFTAHNGAVMHQATRIAVSGCGKAATHAKKHRKATHARHRHH
jgi:uncharacterized repeat protein (TIGR01451 family)